MQKEFESYIQQNSLCSKDDKILVAVSGGADSIVLIHLFISLSYTVSLAHCNFNLRAQESDDDEAFVKDIVSKYNIENHFKAFNTAEYANEKKISIEMAARDLRYSWFAELQKEFGYSKIATGHHLNDSIETIFINLTRGTGINGISGIKPKNNTLIRPLLFATRNQIEEYALENQLHYRNDSSNVSDVYMRNIIRNQIIPLFKGINPSFEETMRQNMEHFSQTATIYNKQIKKVRNNIVNIESEEAIRLSIENLIKQKNNQLYLFEILLPYGFSSDAVAKILASLNKESGRLFFSSTHKILLDREYLILEKLNNEEVTFLIHGLDDFAAAPINLKVSNFKVDEFKLNKNTTIGCFDAQKIAFPLTLRKWKTGDVFYPLGMNKRKKLSDFFIDEKVDRFQKGKIWVLESKGEIAWIVGLRIDNRFKITPDTKKIIQLTLQ